LCSPRNVPRLIDMVYGQELACMGRLRDLKELSEQEDAIDPREWSKLMRVLARDAEIALWRARIEWLQSAREMLEGLVNDKRRSPADGAMRAWGRRGAGKTTLLRIAAGLETLDAGVVRFEGEDLAMLSERAHARLMRERVG